MKVITVFWTILLCSLFSLFSSAQSSKEKKADKRYFNQQYREAITSYNEVKNITPTGKRYLAKSYTAIGEYNNACLTYTSYYSFQHFTPEDIFDYVSVLRLDGKFIESVEWMEQYRLQEPNDTRTKDYVKNRSFIPQLFVDQEQYKIDPLAVNAEKKNVHTNYYDLLNDTIISISNIPIAVNSPWISKNGQVMYFASKDLNNQGNYDIYKALKNSNGNWDNITSAGKNINTLSDEMFPFYNEATGILFFSSNGFLGLGGLDIFISQDLKNGTFSQVQNLGFPLNSNRDDFGFTLDEMMESGFFASNRNLNFQVSETYTVKILLPFVEDMPSSPKSTISIEEYFEDIIVHSDLISSTVNENDTLEEMTTIVVDSCNDEMLESIRMVEDSLLQMMAMNALQISNIPKTLGDEREVSDISSLLEINIDTLSRSNIEVDTSELAIIPIVEEDEETLLIEEEKTFSSSGGKLQYFELPRGSIDSDNISISQLILKDETLLSIYLQVIDKLTGKIIPHIKLTIIDNFTGMEEMVITSSEGEHKRRLPDKSLNERGSYNFVLKHQGYDTKTVTYNLLFDHEGQYDVHKSLDLRMESSLSTTGDSIIPIQPEREYLILME